LLSLGGLIIEDLRLTCEVSLNNQSANGLSVDQALHSKGGATLSRSQGEDYFQFVLVVFLLNILSAILFISLIKRPVYDDIYNMLDVHTYTVEGFSKDALLSQRNAPGPTGFLWMALGARLLPGNELRGARVAVLGSWVLLVTGMLVGARYSKTQSLWSAAMLALLVFPHTLESMATALTEGPSLLFALLGVLAWTESVSHSKVTSNNCVLAVLGGLSMGVAVTCRQYFLALLPAAVFFAFYQSRRAGMRENPRWVSGVVVSLLFAAVPILLLILVWKNISSPGVASGTSYDHMWRASAGLNLSRPIIVAFYTGIYLLPLTFPAMFQLRGSQRRLALLFAVLGGAAITPFNPLFLQPGPLNSLIRFASRLPHGGTTLFAVIAIVAVYNAASVCALLWEQRQVISSCAPTVFALLVILFFVAEQVGVGGNLPFYDRYVLQLAPFLGLIAFTVLPRLTSARVFAFLALSVFSHVMLWRFAFGI
jgi:hypothetical protein